MWHAESRWRELVAHDQVGYQQTQVHVAGRQKPILFQTEAEELVALSNRHRGVRMSALRRGSVLAEALEVARAIRCHDALCRVARAQAKAGLAKEAADTLTESLQAALSIKDRALALNHIAEAQVEAGQINIAIDTLDQALQATQSVKGANDGELLSLATSLTLIAVTRAKAGLLKEAAATFDHSLQAALRVHREDSRADTLAWIAKRQAQAGLVKDAIATLGQARQMAHSIKRLHQRYNALLLVALAQAKVGLLKETAATFNHSLKVALRIDSDEVRANALASIAEAQAQAGSPNDAAATIDQGLRLMPSAMLTSWNLSKAVDAIAETQKYSGQTPEVSAMANHALQLFDGRSFDIVAAIAKLHAKAGKIAEALQLAQSIKADAPVLVSIAEAQAKAGLEKEATTTFDEAVKLAQSIQQEVVRGRQLHSIAEAQAKAGLSTQSLASCAIALQAARSIKDNNPGVRVLVLLAIADVLPE